MWVEWYRWNPKNQSMLGRGGLLPLVMVSFLVDSLNHWFYLTIGFHQVGAPAAGSRAAGSKLLENGLRSKYVRPVVS